MDETIKVVINDKDYVFFKGISLEEVAKTFQNTCKYPIILAKVNNSIRELNYQLTKNCEIKFLDLKIYLHFFESSTFCTIKPGLRQGK